MMQYVKTMDALARHMTCMPMCNRIACAVQSVAHVILASGKLSRPHAQVFTGLGAYCLPLLTGSGHDT